MSRGEAFYKQGYVITGNPDAPTELPDASEGWFLGRQAYACRRYLCR